MVLITERNDILREIYDRLLSRAGYSTVVMRSAEESSGYIESGGDEVELLVLCLNFPDAPESLLVEKVREKFSDCKILLIVDEMTEETRNFITKCRADACLTKPFLPSDLLKRISLFHL